jgi:hypothetical protein
MAGPFQVFVEGATAAGPDALTQLARAMSKRYGLPADDLIKRLAVGRFRVKSNCDRAAADALVEDLKLIGARCAIDDMAGKPAATPATAPTMPMGQTTPPAMARTTSGSAQFQSGLSAAFSGQLDATNLGALSDGDIPLSLASLDGEPEAMPPPGAQFAAPADAAPPRPLPRPESSSKAPPLHPGGVPRAVQPTVAAATAPTAAPIVPVAKREPLIDMFAPPEAQEAALVMDLAPEDPELRARKRATAPPGDGSSGAARFARTSTSPIPPTPTAVMSRRARGRLGILSEESSRFVIGVFVAVVLGFVPAHVISGMRERTAFAAIDSKVKAVQGSVDTVEEYQALDTMRAEQLDKKRSDRRSIAIGGLVMWALVGAGIAYVWFRRLPWDDWDRA